MSSSSVDCQLVPSSHSVSASQVTAQGKGLTHATVNQQTSFTVDSSHAGTLRSVTFLLSEIYFVM